MVIVPNPAALKVRQLNLAFNDVGKDVWERALGAVESGHGRNLEGGDGLCSNNTWANCGRLSFGID